LFTAFAPLSDFTSTRLSNSITTATGLDFIADQNWRIENNYLIILGEYMLTIEFTVNVFDT
jgi:hypothetical protein